MGLASEQGLTLEEASSRIVLGRLSTAAGRLQEAEETLARALAQAREIGFLDLEARALIAWADLLQRTGRDEEAQRSLAEARSFPLIVRLDRDEERALGRG